MRIPIITWFTKHDNYIIITNALVCVCFIVTVYKTDTKTL